ncbi:transport permease protein [Longispora fulva]|uniref:Transport permease protein n=1 Tax=Longispora fulva TaxID=619741 RepID=A0A8J7GPE9_9ACTN|nr:ABC transporter permease [Longispora fulva]MBG6140843.1 ABC-2 type transport system permease protein [Longispora fulva]GIG60893.1 transport permease protein [Longispora fulva]
MRVIVLGVRRGRLEIKQFLRSRESVVFTLAFPIVMVTIFSLIYPGSLASGVRYSQYIVTGMIAAGLLATGFQGLGMQIPMERDRGVLKRLAGTPMPKASYFIGKILMVLAIGAICTALLLAYAVLFIGVTLPTDPARWLTFAWVFVLGITGCTLLGIAASSLVSTGRGASAVVTPIALVFQFISGVYFVFTSLPGWMQQVAALFPLKWMCQGMRSVFLPESQAAFEPAGSWELGRVALVLAAWVVIGLALCMLTFRWTSRRDG